MLAHERPPPVNEILSMSAARLDALADQVADGLANSGLGDSVGRRDSWSVPSYRNTKLRALFEPHFVGTAARIAMSLPPAQAPYTSTTPATMR